MTIEQLKAKMTDLYIERDALAQRCHATENVLRELFKHFNVTVKETTDIADMIKQIECKMQSK